MRMRIASCVVVAVLAFVATSRAADWGLKEGTPDLKSAGPLAFGPDGILAVGDVKAAAIFAIDTNDRTGDPATAEIKASDLNGQIADAVGASASELTINDMAVNPLNGNVYFSVSAGADQAPALVVFAAGGQPKNVPLSNVLFAKVELPDAPEDREQGEGTRRRNLRLESITDLAYIDGKLLVSGLSNAASPSTIREIPFPFSTPDAGTAIEIYHGAHGRVEDNATPRVFIPFEIDGEPSLLAGFTCTPLVKFPLGALEPGEKVRGTTVAELGNRNRPLDMISYEKDGQTWLLIANSARGVMKVSTADIGKREGIEAPVKDGGTAGQPYETIESLKGVVQLDKLNATQAVLLVQNEGGTLDLSTVELP